MVDAAFTAKFQDSEWGKAFAALQGPVKESLMRRMLVEGGVLLRNAAAGNARLAANKEGVDVRGVLAAAIYLAFNDKIKSESYFQYTITWNAKKAPHGHLIEFGHWMKHPTYKGRDGNWYTNKSVLLPKPVWIDARPFLRPTMDSYGNVAVRAMLIRGEKELPELLQGIKNGNV